LAQDANLEIELRKKELEYQALLDVRNAQWGVPLAFFTAAMQQGWIKDFASLLFVSLVSWVAYRMLGDEREKYEKKLRLKLNEVGRLSGGRVPNS